MKRFISIFVIIFCSNVLQARKNAVPKALKKSITLAFNAPDLGKTHFIVGLPAQSMPEVKPELVVQACPADKELSARIQCHDGHYRHAFFSPDDDLQTILIKLIENEQKSIKIAIYSFTDSAIAQAIINASIRAVEVEIITDISCLRDRFNKIELLYEHNLKVHVYNPKNKGILNDIMHNKFIIFGKNSLTNGKAILWTGSYNFTKSAHKNNQENAVLIDDKKIIERYEKQFEILKERITTKEPLLLAYKKNNAIA